MLTSHEQHTNAYTDARNEYCLMKHSSGAYSANAPKTPNGGDFVQKVLEFLSGSSDMAENAFKLCLVDFKSERHKLL